MDDHELWQFTCKTCGGHLLTVTHLWSITVGHQRETWKEWGPLEPTHLWHYRFKEKINIEEREGDKDEPDDFRKYADYVSYSEPGLHEKLEQELEPERDEFYVNCAGCDREIEFGWSQLNGGGQIFPVECANFTPGEVSPDPRYWDAWEQKHWLRREVASDNLDEKTPTQQEIIFYDFKNRQVADANSPRLEDAVGGRQP